MARFLDHNKALILRKEGKSYSQIKRLLNVSKGTLSVWLKNYPLTKGRIRELRDWNEARIEKYRDTIRKKREFRLNTFYWEQKKIILPLTKKELYMAGLFLYLGEGAKSKTTELSVTNTNPAIIKFFIYWINKSFGIEKDKLKIQLHLYKDMDINYEIKYWLNSLKLSAIQFYKPYIKKSNKKSINHKGDFGHGTCAVIYGNARLTEKIHMAMKVINDKFMGM
jgi:hypothetical protein